MGRYLEVLLLGGKGIFVWGIFARLPHLGFFLQGSHRKAHLAPEPTQNKKTTMETSRANAKEAILSLLLSFPDDVRCTYYTVDELVRVLMRGGVSPSLEISLVRSSLQHVPTRHEVNIQRRRPEKMSGLDVAKPFCRFSRTADDASPRSQRNGT